MVDIPVLKGQLLERMTLHTTEQRFDPKPWNDSSPSLLTASNVLLAGGSKQLLKVDLPLPKGQGSNGWPFNKFAVLHNIDNNQMRTYLFSAASQEDPKQLLKVDLPLPKGQVFDRMAWGPDGTIAAALGGHIHFIDSRYGSVGDTFVLCRSHQLHCYVYDKVSV